MKKIMLCAMLLLITAVLPSCKPQANEADKTLAQFEMPAKGEEIAVIETSMGTIKARLFPQYTPKASENFATHANNGYYDNLIFHRVINQFIIQGGDPLGTGMGGESIWGAPFEREMVPELVHIRGALCMAKSQAEVSQGSQFYIVTNNDLDAFYTDGAAREQAQYYLDNMDESLGPDADGKERFIRDYVYEEQMKSYLENGGALHLDRNYTVFGQVFEGFDVLDAIQSVETLKGESDSDPMKDRPVTDVTIISIKMEKY